MFEVACHSLTLAATKPCILKSCDSNCGPVSIVRKVLALTGRATPGGESPRVTYYVTRPAGKFADGCHSLTLAATSLEGGGVTLPSRRRLELPGLTPVV